MNKIFSFHTSLFFNEIIAGKGYLVMLTKNKTIIPLTLIFVFGILGSANSQAPTKEKFEKAGWVEMNGVMYTGNFYAKGEIEYNERNVIFDIKARMIRAVYITDYKFCSPGVKDKVAWISLGGKMKMLKVDHERRRNKKSPLYIGSIIGHRVWLEFPGPEYMD